MNKGSAGNTASERSHLLTGEQSAALEQRRVSFHGRTDEEVLDELSTFDGDSEEDQKLFHELTLKAFRARPWYKRPRPETLAAILMLYMIAQGSVISAKITLISRIACEYYRKEHELDAIALGINGDEGQSICLIPEVQQEASKIQLWCQVLLALIASLSCGRLGELSDRFGRKPILYFSLGCTFLCECIFYTSVQPGSRHAIPGILAANFLEGLGGSFMLIIAICNSYATDCTDAIQRSKAIGLFLAMLFVGLATGPLLGSAVIKRYGDDSSALLFDMCCLVLAFFLLVLLVPESRAKHVRRRSQSIYDARRIRRQLSIDGENWLHFLKHELNLMEPLEFFYKCIDRRSTKDKISILVLLLIDFILFGVSLGAGTPIIYYTQKHFKWTAVDLGYYLSVAGTSRVIVLLVLLPLALQQLKKRFAVNDTGLDAIDVVVIRTGLLAEVLGILGQALSSVGVVFVAFSSLSSLGAASSAVIQSAIIKFVPGNKVGELLGALALFHNLERILMPIAFIGLYSMTVETLPGAFYGVLVTLVAFSFIASFGLKESVSATPAEETEDTHM